jgi:CRP/FNR family transcriptional regulator, cyclic AMP receptor protein
MPSDLKKIPLFAGLQDEDLRDLANKAVTRTFPKNMILISEGDLTDSLYVILSGKVKIYLGDESGKELLLDVKGPGEYFGEMMLEEGSRSASVMTAETSQLAAIARNDFKDFLREHPDIALHVIKNLIRMVRGLNENVKSLAMLDVYGRVSRLLLDLAIEQDGNLVILEKLTQKDMASRVGASREMINRILRDLTTGGYIKLEGGKITIKKTPPNRW